MNQEFTVWVEIETVDSDTEKSDTELRYHSQTFYELSDATKFADEIASSFCDLTAGHCLLITRRVLHVDDIDEDDAEFLAHWLQRIFPTKWFVEQHCRTNEWSLSTPMSTESDDKYREYIGAAQALLELRKRLESVP